MYMQFLHADNDDWLDCPDAQADLSLCLAHMSQGTLFDVVVQIFITKPRLFKYIENFTSKN